MIKLPIPSLSGFETGRLRFRPLTLADTDWWMAYIRDPESIRFMAFELGNPADCERMIQRSLDRYERDGSGLHAIELLSTGEPVGQCGLLTQVVDDIDELEIGYHLLPSRWGHGYATEAAMACKTFAKSMGLAPSLISLIDPGNTRSQAVAARNGMSPGKRTVHRGVEAIVYRIDLGQGD